MRTLLIDSDIVAYAYAAKGERKYEWDEGEVTRVADPIEESIDRMRAHLTDLQRTLKADALIVCLSDPVRNFRKDVLPTYKANRAGAIKPEHLFPLKDWLAENYRSYVRPGLEADDIMGILATHPTLIRGEKVIVSIDKDLAQIPGKLYNPRTQKMRVITAEAGELLHYTQMLTGDPVDGYSGCPGIGPKKAAAILDVDPALRWTMVLNTFVARGHTADDALAQARVAKILQHTDYDFKRKEPILWNPPGSV